MGKRSKPFGLNKHERMLSFVVAQCSLVCLVVGGFEVCGRYLLTLLVWGFVGMCFERMMR